MHKKLFLLAFCCAGALQLRAQELYKPRDVQRAFDKGTRAMDGKPGKNTGKTMAATIFL